MPRLARLPNLNDPQTKALTLALQERGGVYAGHGTYSGGRTVKIDAMTLQALERRGLVETFIHPDGGLGAKPTRKARELVKTVAA
jgi:hypothetical protein